MHALKSLCAMVSVQSPHIDYQLLLVLYHLRLLIIDYQPLNTRFLLHKTYFSVFHTKL